MKPDISIIICTYNRCQILKGILGSLLRQSDSTLFDWEVVVVDNNSCDGTKSVIESFQPRFQGRLRYAFEPQQGLSHARNRGIREARGRIIAFTDDDCEADSSWLSQIFGLFQNSGCAAMGGRILPVFPLKTPAWFKQHVDLLHGPIGYYDYGQDIKPYAPPMIEMFGANMAFRREVFERFGSFRTDLGVGQGLLGEETEMVKRLLKNGLNIYYCGKALIWHGVKEEETNLRRITRWNMSLGRYRFLIDEKGITGPHLVHYFGIPRYLLRETLQKVVSVIGSLFNQRQLLQNWILLSRTIGKIQAIRKCYLYQKTAARKDV